MPTPWQAELSVIVTAYNEEVGIRPVLGALRDTLPDAEIIVVDDASKDGTAAQVTAAGGVKLIQHPFNRGYGASLKSGMRAATGTYIAWFDADNEHRVEDLIAMTDSLVENQLAAVIGERRNPAPSALRFFGKYAIRMLARSLGAKAVKDINCGLRVFQRDAIIRYMPLLPDKFSASTTSTMILMERGYPVEFFRITLNDRAGASKVMLSDGFSALFTVLRIIMLVAPMRIFVSSGLIATGFGGFYGLVRMIDLGGSFPFSAFVIISFGMFLFVLGLIADQISQQRLAALDEMGSTSSGGSTRDA